MMHNVLSNTARGVFLTVLLALPGLAAGADSDWQLAFEDGFDRQDLERDWDILLGTGSIVDGRLYITGYAATAMINRGFASDVRLEFEAEVDPHLPPCDVACGLGGNNFVGYGYLLQFGANHNQYNQLVTALKSRKQDSKVYQVDRTPPFKIEYGKKYECVGTKEGRRITYHVNGVKLLDATDDDVLGGPPLSRVCVVTWSGMYVDNVKVFERKTPLPDGPIYLKDARTIDIGYRWRDRVLRYEGSTPLPEAIRQGIEAYNGRKYKEAYELFAGVTPPTPESVRGLAYVVGDLGYKETEADQARVASLAADVSRSRPDDPGDAAFARVASWFKEVTLASRDKQNTERIHCIGPENNPFYYKNNLFRARYQLAIAKESGWARNGRQAMEIFTALKRLWPDHAGIAQITGERTTWGPELTRKEGEGPKWARDLQEGLARSHAVLNWWFTDRQTPDGQLGGGWGDDVELLRSWGMPAAITTAGETAVAGIQRLADGVWKYALNEMKPKPSDRSFGDVEHMAEDAGDTQPLMMLLRYGDPEYVERNLQVAKLYYTKGMGINERGGLQFKSAELGQSGANLDPSATGQNIYHCRAMRHAVWLAWLGVPEARDMVLRWADNLRDVAMAEIGPKPAGYMPFTIFWPSGSIYPPGNRSWLDPKAHYYGTRADKLWKYHFALCSAYYLSGDRKFLEPIDRMMDMACMSPGTVPYDESLSRDHIKNLLADFSRENAPDLSSLYHWLTGSSVYDGNGVSEPVQFLIDQNLSRFAKGFERAVEGLRYNWEQMTSEVLQTDRMDLPGDVPIFGAYTGSPVSLVEDALVPTITVTWVTPDLNFATVVTSSTPERLRVLVYSFNEKTTRIGLRPWLLHSGKYLLSNGESAGGAFRPIRWEKPAQITYMHRGAPIFVDVPSRKTWVVDLRLQERIIRPDRLPDLAINRRDIRIDGDNVVVTLHNIGAAETDPFTAILEDERNGQWSEVSRVSVPGLPGIKDLEPVKRDIVLRRTGADAGGHWRVAVDPEDRVDELYELNNQVTIGGAESEAAGQPSTSVSPITAEHVKNGSCASFTNRLHPGNRIGYRFHEHTPIAQGRISADVKEAGIDPAAVARLERIFAARPGVLKHTVRIGDKDWVPQQWTFYLAPVEDGIDLLLIAEAGDVGLNEYYGVQQCFRMSGVTNDAWRWEIAKTPAFSEYDLWNLDEKGRPDKTSLTHVPRSGKWAQLPATTQPVGARTPLGVRVDGLRAGGRAETMLTVGPYDARMLDPVDSGLIARTSREGGWICGVYWEGTSHVTDHHPADCLHSIVNIGGIPARARRAVRGKIYWFQGDLRELLARWQRDWPGGSAASPRQ